MIPKIIHYCWFGKREKPESVMLNINTWKKILPDYIIKEWNEDNFDIDALPFTREAYAAKKYAFVSDVVRLYALMTEGGIYLDTDVTVVKSFNAFLHNHSFIGKESPFTVSTAIIGAEPCIQWIVDFYNKYFTKHFITRMGRLTQPVNTILLTKQLNSTFPAWIKDLKIYEIDFFSVKLYPSMQYLKSENTVSIHEYSGTWITNKLTIFQRIKFAYIRYRINVIN